MAEVRIKGDPEHLVAARGLISRLAEEFEDDGLTPDEFEPRLRAIEERIDEARADVRKAIREAS